eukprot:1159005-Pelagomonas_calceolata.AAC.3
MLTCSGWRDSGSAVLTCVSVHVDEGGGVGCVCMCVCARDSGSAVLTCVSVHVDEGGGVGVVCARSVRAHAYVGVYSG